MKTPLLPNIQSPKNCIVLLWCLLFLFPVKAIGQQNENPPLEREVTIQADNSNIESILSDISTQTGVIFSYNPEALNTSAKTSVHRKRKPVRIVLDDLYGNTITYKSRGKYVILKKNPVKSNKEIEVQRIEGYIYDSQTGNKLTEASVYDNSLEASAVTDKYGYFSIEIPANKSITSLRVSKAGYSDTMLLTDHIDKKIQNIEILTVPKDSVKKKNIFTNIDLPKLTPQWLIPKKVKINAANISDSVLSFAQFSLIPPLSTNRFMTGNALNKLSFNATVGYVQGVELAEFGGIINIDLGNVKYAQFAGVANFVGGNVIGYQSAGTMNFAKSVKGVQNSGGINVSAGNADVQVAGVGNFATTNIVQVAGAINISEKSVVQLAGVYNQTNEVNVQTAGVTNVAQNVHNVQVAGVHNHTVGEVGEVQVAGVINYASKVGQVQVAGCVNIAKVSVGNQIAGLVNIAGYAKQSQIGLINIADSCGGIPIGLFSFIKKGYHQLEISTDELLSSNFAFRTGAKQFHTSIGGGASYGNYHLFNVSYGIGTTLGRSVKTNVDIELFTRMLMDTKSFAYAGNLHSVYVGIDRRVNRKFSIAAGVTYNLHFTNSLNSQYKPEYASLAPYTVSNFEFTNGTSIKTWFGGKVAFRFF